MNLSREEQQVLENKEFFLLKRNVSLQLDDAFAALQASWMADVATWPLPIEGIDRTRGKIFKGENYLFFPYTIMDFPRHFSKEAVFAVRTMCWWGNECSVTLHLQGNALSPYLSTMEQRLDRLKKEEFFFGINNTPWVYHFEEDNYAALHALDDKRIVGHLQENGFLKLALRIPFSDLDKLESRATYAMKSFREFLL